VDVRIVWMTARVVQFCVYQRLATHVRADMHKHVLNRVTPTTTQVYHRI